MKKALFLSFIMVFACLLLQAQEEEQATYFNEIYQYSLSYPKSWEGEENEENGTATFYVPLQEGETVYKQLQISVARWEEGDLNDFLQATFIEDDLRKLFPDITIRDLGGFNSTDKETHSFELNYTMNEEKITTLYYMQKTADIVCIILAESPQNEYAVYKEKYLEIINSLIIH